MFLVNDCVAHARYLTDLMQQRQRGLYWYGLFDHARRLAASKRWDAARDALERAMSTAETTLANAEETLARYRGAYNLLTGACFLGQENLEEPLRYYKYAEATFNDANDYYGLAVTYYARGLLYHALSQWRSAYSAYTQASEFAYKPIPVDDILRRMRVDLQDRIVQVHEGMFERLDETGPLGETPEPPTGKPAPAAADSPVSASPAARGGGDELEAPKKDTPPAVASISSDHARENEGIIQLAPIVQSVSAGRGIWDQSSKDILDYIEIDRLRIHDKGYGIKTLTSTGSTVLRLQRKYKYGAFRVVGESMNARGIADQDYVLVEEREAKPSSAFNGEIICALISPEERAELVIKRFQWQDDQVILYFENLENKFPPRALDVSQVFVLGKVVAVLKSIA